MLESLSIVTMKRYCLIILTTIMTTLWGCNNDNKKLPETEKLSNDNRRFPEVRKLAGFKQTEFLPTLEHEISNNQNAIYSATLLFAWDEIRKKIEQPIDIDNSYASLTLLNNSKSFINVLHTNEYNASGKIEGEVIRAKAEFSMSLPFGFKLTSFTNELTFANKKVASFGQVGYDYNTSGIIQILYYKDDSNFILKLSPKNKEHEVILIKSSNTYKNITKILSVITKNIELGKKEKQSSETRWRYYLNAEDEVIIPKLQFNIENNYASLEGKNLKAGNRDYLIETAYQRTAFILDESGAEIESEAEVAVAAAAASEETKPQLKKMRFDKPFFLILKRTDSNYPYLGLWVNNTELMLMEE